MRFFVSDDAFKAQGQAASTHSGPFPEAYRDSTHAGPRLVVCPPQIYVTARPIWRTRLKAIWSLVTASNSSPRLQSKPIAQLQLVRDEFLGALAELDDAEAERLRESIAKARSLREMWHLRSLAYDLISHQYGESQAHARLSALNSHFPVRLAQTNRSSLFGTRTVSW